MNKELVILWAFITLLRFGQTLAIWWFIFSFFRRSFKKYKNKIFISSVITSLMILLYNAIHVSDPFLIFLFEVPIYTLSHYLILKQGWSLAIIETVVGYYLYRISETDIAVLFNWSHIISVQDAVTKVDQAVLIQFILPFIFILVIQMLLAKRNWGYYFVNNRIVPNKLYWAMWSIVSTIILCIYDRVLDELRLFKIGYYGMDEQPYLIFFVGLALFILWKINTSEWEKHYQKQSVCNFYKKQLTPLNLRKIQRH